MKRYTAVILVIFFLFAGKALPQYENENNLRTFSTWFILQLVPSPNYSQDTDNITSELLFGLRWQITPVNYSWSTNKYIPAFSFFKVNPVNRFAGSVEVFMQPEWAATPFSYSDLSRFRFSSGLRFNLPLIEKGEYMYMSLGGKYTRGRNHAGNEVKEFFSAEAGLYTLYGALGLQYNRNFTYESRYNFGLTFRFY